MSSSIWTAATALRNHQTFMNVVANNIANMNTIGFKSSNITFQDMLSRTLHTGAEPTENRGGLNPIQYGLGMQLGSINNNMAQGTLHSTGRGQDLAITGSGFFVYAGPQQTVYSRDGALGVDIEGNLVSLSTGLRVQGWTADVQGMMDTLQPVDDIQLPTGKVMRAKATSEVIMNGNLDASVDVGAEIPTRLVVFDSLGEQHEIEIVFRKTSANPGTWGLSASVDQSSSSPITNGTPDDTDGDGMPDTFNLDWNIRWEPSTNPANPFQIQFDANGSLQIDEVGNPPQIPNIVFDLEFDNGADFQQITLDLSDVTQLSDPGNSRVNVTLQDGRAAGEMLDFNINSDGKIIGVYSNGMLETLGQLAVAEFANPAGLTKAGQNGYVESGNSGGAEITAAGDRSQIAAGFLEMSNVDLTLEFSEMIRAQRGFQANSRVITSSDEMLQELVNLVR